MISIKDVSFSYMGSESCTLEHISLDISRGDYISIVGNNGSGKSTLLKLILGFLTPTAGAIENKASRIGYVPQAAFADKDFPITVREVIRSYGKLLRLKHMDVEKILSFTGMEGFSRSLMGNLSGGQHQKVLIARALMGDPDLLVLDEPSTGVDIESQRDIYDALSSLNRERQLTVLSVEHNLEAAVRNSTMLYHISDGRGHLCSASHYIEEFIKKEGGHARI